MDIGSIFNAPMRDPDWLKKCALIGVMLLIPIAGALNMLGWMKAAYARAKAGDTTLPPASLEYIGSGWALFLAMLPIFLLQIIAAIVLSVIPALLHSSALMLILTPFRLVISLGLTLAVMPAVVYRHVTEGTGFGAGFDVAGIQRVIMSDVGTFAMFAVAYLLAQIVSGLGLVACCVGVFVSAPFAQAMIASAILQFENTRGGRAA